MRKRDASIIGWDLGGAHVKACLLMGGKVREVVQWACPLWLGLDRLDQVLEQAATRWPHMRASLHAVTMSGEMTDLFEHREQGVLRLAQRMADLPGMGLAFYAGEQGWCQPEQVGAAWPSIASANWLATAHLAARRIGQGVLVDIGSTTCDLIPLRDGAVVAQGLTDAGRLASGELVYSGVVRTPLCGLARRIAFRGQPYNVMNELFATTADVYRLTGELDPRHDAHPAADNGPKDFDATQRRLARMIGMDGREARPSDWLAFAHTWRSEQLGFMGEALERVLARAQLSADAPLVSAGCGDFLVAELAARFSRPLLAFATDVAQLDAGTALTTLRWAQVCAPSLAVAQLFAQENEPAP